ncbi:MAG TPA: UDP-N-acetylglucosamine--N-acetylmuramyl-(pentapeptide) pyrophosphoryl-undecaprenol N-acetylglucosamine transferase [Candidatus Limnocylindrales bacterium]|nr:UDP-N-acetylglucosamine--N-acetylmuramyl-(pentapeptide) pyrophosphoryl-undecaprenol N-acetylglucosamine transferase [Candidatus Limnocylindrales bacterium]
MRLLIAGGGTGGHIYPALAVARSLRARPTPPELVWLGGRRGLEAGLVKGAGIRVRRLVLRSLRTVDISVHTVADPLRLAASVPQAAAILARERPAAIFTTGGYVAVPTLLAAEPLRIPVVLWDGNVVPGRAVRYTARLSDAIAVAHEATGRALAGSGAPWFLTGTPIRDVTEVSRADARRRLDLPDDARVMLIFGGSQAVARFNAAVSDALPRLVERCFVMHVAGDEGYSGALAAREQLPTEGRTRYRPYPFLRDEMLPALVAADLVVGRAGSSTLAEVTALGIPSVIVPYPHAAGHQTLNARVLADAGAARLIADEDFDADALVAAADLLAPDGDAARAAMADAARSLGRPGAADAVATLVLAAAERRPLPPADEIERISRGAAA